MAGTLKHLDEIIRTRQYYHGGFGMALILKSNLTGKTLKSVTEETFSLSLVKIFVCCRRLHPAMYLLALGYRMLDIEDANRRKETVRDVVEGQLSSFLSWCKKLV